MNGRFLLDTNIVIAIFAHNTDVLLQLSLAEEIFVPVTVIGELYYGVTKSERVTSNTVHMDIFVKNSTILNIDSGIARCYGEIKNTLRLKGRPIPENDIWIAATAFYHNLTLVTRDAHFEEVDNLSLIQW